MCILGSSKTSYTCEYLTCWRDNMLCMLGSVNTSYTWEWQLWVGNSIQSDMFTCVTSIMWVCIYYKRVKSQGIRVLWSYLQQLIKYVWCMINEKWCHFHTWCYIFMKVAVFMALSCMAIYSRATVASHGISFLILFLSFFSSLYISINLCSIRNM